MVTLASYQANHLIRNCCLLHVLWDQRQCDVAGHTDEQASTRERSRCDVRAHRDVCEESTPGSHHHHQHQETSSQSHNVTYLTMPNTNTPIIMCLCYSARRDMLDPQTSLDPIFFPIPSFMAKTAWIHKYPFGSQHGADPMHPWDQTFKLSILSTHAMESFRLSTLMMQAHE